MNQAPPMTVQSEASSPMPAEVSTPGGSQPSGGSSAKQKRSSLACIRCRTRHIRCPGGNPCKKCQLAKAKCEYIEADKKIVVSMKYLSKLHDDIARLKKDNATLRNNLKEEELKGIPTHAPGRETGNTLRSSLASGGSLGANMPPGGESDSSRFSATFGVNQNFSTSTSSSSGTSSSFTEVIHPSLDKHGRLIQSRTGEKLYVGSSSMTLFGLEIQNMVPSFSSSNLFPSISSTNSPDVHTPGSTTSSQPSTTTSSGGNKRETKILEKEGNAYKIILAKTNTRPGISINFTLPSYSYAMLLVDTFVNYNDGCFYFFNEGLIKKFLMNLYSGKMEENKKILKRNISQSKGPAVDENTIKKDTDDDTILETIWFCKVLLIFATGEMYLGTESDTHRKKGKKGPTVKTETTDDLQDSGINNSKSGCEGSPNMGRAGKNGKSFELPKNTLPGSGFFYQASELFTGLFASGAIDNTVKDGGIEVMLLYAFYLQVADCTIASYFYFGLALRSTLILGWHVDADKENLNRFELEHRRRIWWTVYMYERMLSSKAGLPLSFADDSVSTEFPVDFNPRLEDFPRDDSDVRGFYLFPPAEYINNCVIITQINAMILLSLYTKQPTINILPVVSDLVQKLMNWKSALPEFLKVDFTESTFEGEEGNNNGSKLKVSRLVVNLMTEYFQGINLAVRPLLFHFATKKLKELQQQQNLNKYVDLTKYSKNVLTLLNASFQASINSIRCIWALVPENMVALFGWMDREYLFTSASTLILFNASFGVHEATKDHLDHALTIFTKMKRLGNYPAALRRSQLLKLISVLDFNGVMYDLLKKHDDEGLYHNHGNEGFNAMSVLEFANIHQKSSGLDLDMYIPQPEFQPTNHIHRHPVVEQTVPPPAGAPIRPTQQHPQQQHIPSQYNNGYIEEVYPPPLVDIPEIETQMELETGGAFSQYDNVNSVPMPSSGDVYMNSDLAGIEGLTYIDEEQQLWNEITNDAVWLNMPTHNQTYDNNSSVNRANDNIHNNTNNTNNNAYNNDNHNNSNTTTTTTTNNANNNNNNNNTNNKNRGKDFDGVIHSLTSINPPSGPHGLYGEDGYGDIINLEFQSM